jgi:hypothetical protein
MLSIPCLRHLISTEAYSENLNPLFNRTLSIHAQHLFSGNVCMLVQALVLHACSAYELGPLSHAVPGSHFMAPPGHR